MVQGTLTSHDLNYKVIACTKKQHIVASNDYVEYKRQLLTLII